MLTCLCAPPFSLPTYSQVRYQVGASRILVSLPHHFFPSSICIYMYIRSAHTSAAPSYVNSPGQVYNAQILALISLQPTASTVLMYIHARTSMTFSIRGALLFFILAFLSGLD